MNSITENEFGLNLHVITECPMPGAEKAELIAKLEGKNEMLISELQKAQAHVSRLETQITGSQKQGIEVSQPLTILLLCYLFNVFFVQASTKARGHALLHAHLLQCMCWAHCNLTTKEGQASIPLLYC